MAGPYGIEDVPFWDIQRNPQGLGQWAGIPAGIDKMFSGVIPVLVMNKDTGVIEERAITEQVYYSSVGAGTSPGGGWTPIWDFEPEIPNTLFENTILKLATGLIDIVATKAAPAALVARAIERSAAASQGGVESLAVIRAIIVNSVNGRMMVHESASKLGVGNAGGARPGWPIQGQARSIGYGEVIAKSNLSMGTNQVGGTYPFNNIYNGAGLATAYEGFTYGQPSSTDDNTFNQVVNQTLCPFVLTPGRVLHFVHTAAPGAGAPGELVWTTNALVTVIWSEFAV